MKTLSSDSIREIENKVLAGRALFLIMQRSGFYLKDYAKALKIYRDSHGGRLCTTVVTLHRALGRRKVPDVYSTVLKQMTGKDTYQKWLEVVYRERPDLFSEATIK